ncbi:MAG TPA: SRPBCC domain-containing protein [Thermoplasmata archaeon]|nr:SRPBCC domain-containing protein [Thermoplasmata archaeon]
MAADDQDPILIQITVPLPTAMILGAFTDATQLAGWLCTEAEVEPKAGGRYDLTFSEPEAFTSHGTVTALTPEVDIGFTWEPPAAYRALLATRGDASTVYVRLQESPEGIDVTLEHAPWGAGDEWEEARSWHFRLWDERLHGLKEFLLKAAYG